MMNPTTITNGGSLEDCHTNFFALVSKRLKHQKIAKKKANESIKKNSVRKLKGIKKKKKQKKTETTTHQNDSFDFVKKKIDFIFRFVHLPFFTFAFHSSRTFASSFILVVRCRENIRFFPCCCLCKRKRKTEEAKEENKEKRYEQK